MPLQQKPHLPAASGYQQLASVLSTPVFAKSFIKRFHATTISGLITSSDIVPKEFIKEGDEVVFRRAPTVEVFQYQKNQDLEVSHLTTSLVTMNVNRALYSNLKLDTVDEKTLNLKEFLSEFQSGVTREIAEHIDREVLLELPMQAAACNRGRRAGRRSQAFDFGTKGAPVVLTPNNIINYLVALRTVLSEQNIDTNGMYVVLPTEAQALIFTNPVLMNACATGTGKSIVLGTTVPNIIGFDIIFSNNMPQYNENGRRAYTILAGRKDATGFVNRLNHVEYIDKDPRSFAQYWRTLNIYDFTVLTPEALAVLYATFDFNTSGV